MTAARVCNERGRQLGRPYIIDAKAENNATQQSAMIVTEMMVRRSMD